MYSSVPITEPAAVCVAPPSTERAMPKSMISASPPSGTGSSAGLLDHDVLGLEVAVDDALFVRGGETLRHLLRDRDHARQRQRVAAAQDLRQRLAFDERHRQVLDAVDLAEVVNADDVLVGDLAREHQLALEALFELLRGGRVRLRRRTNHLDRHRDAELVVEGLVDGAHAAGAEQLQDRVARVDLLPRLERSITGAGRAGAATDCRARSPCRWARSSRHCRCRTPARSSSRVCPPALALVGAAGGSMVSGVGWRRGVERRVVNLRAAVRAKPRSWRHGVATLHARWVGVRPIILGDGRVIIAQFVRRRRRPRPGRE